MRGGLMQPPAQPPGEPPMEDDTQDLTQEPDSYFGGGEQATPEEQAEYEAAMDMVWGRLYAGDSKSAEKTVKLLSEGQTDLPQIGVKIGQMAYTIMTTLDADYEERGEVMSESVRLEVSIGVVEELLEIAETAGIIPTDDASLEELVTVAMDEFGSKYGRHMAEKGYINPQASQALLHEMRSVAGERLGVEPSAPDPMAQGVQGANEQMAPPPDGMPPGGQMPPQGGMPA